MHRLCYELRSIIEVDVFWGAAAQEQRVQHLKQIVSPNTGTSPHSQRLSRVLVQDGQHLEAATVVALVVHVVDSPDVIGMGRVQLDDRAVLVIEPSALSVPLRQPEQRKDYKGQGEVCLNYAEMPET